MTRFALALGLVLSLGAVVPTYGSPADDHPHGIDVSSHNHSGNRSIDWAAEAAAGLSFAFVKATEGTTYVNPYFHSDYHAAKDAGIIVGAYVFARPDDPDVVGQADFLVDTMQWATDGRTMPPMVDLEWPYFNAPMCYGLTPEQMVSWISRFVGRVEERIGRPPTIYTNVHWWNPCTGSSPDFARNPLDVSTCDDQPPVLPGWGDHWTFWQFDIPGCGRGSTRDSDVFHGTADDLAAFAAPPTLPAPALSSEPSTKPFTSGARPDDQRRIRDHQTRAAQGRPRG